jgi:hypothetical protein
MVMAEDARIQVYLSDQLLTAKWNLSVLDAQSASGVLKM